MSTNGPVSMYKMKPLFQLDGEIKAETNMYRMKSFQSGDGAARPEDDVEEVEVRQETLLKMIADLRKLLEAITTVLRAPKIVQTPENMVAEPDFSKVGITHDVVLNINPQYPLFSLLGLKNIWECFARVRYTWHVHSSIRSLPANAKLFQEKLSVDPVDGKSPLNVTVVWKNIGKDCEFIVSPIKSVPVLGEANFLRFLNRVMMPDLEIELQAIVDERLDNCHLLCHTTSEKDTVNIFKEVTEGLNNYEYLMGDTLTVVDLAAWSAIKRMKKPPLDEKLCKWFDRCDKNINS